MGRARRIVLWVLAAEVAILVLTGVALYFRYRPTAAQAWNMPDLRPEIQFAARMRIVHRVMSTLTLYTAIAAAALLFARTRVVAVALPVVVAAASLTGYLLPWDQLALRAVTVGMNLNGFRPLFSDQARFVLFDNVEVGTGTVIRWLLVHMLLLGPAVAALVVVGRRNVTGCGPKT